MRKKMLPFPGSLRCVAASHPAHQVEVFFCFFQQVFPDDVCFGLRRFRSLRRRYLEELVQHQCVLAVAWHGSSSRCGRDDAPAFAGNLFPRAFLLVRPTMPSFILWKMTISCASSPAKQHQHAGGKISLSGASSARRRRAALPWSLYIYKVYYVASAHP